MNDNGMSVMNQFHIYFNPLGAAFGSFFEGWKSVFLCIGLGAVSGERSGASRRSEIVGMDSLSGLRKRD